MAADSRIFPWQEPLWRQWQSVLGEGRLPHALLLAGVRGTGKRAFARRLAEAHLCAADAPGSRPCGQCRDCRWLAAGSHPDFLALAPEEGKTELTVDAVRGLGAALTLTGTSGRRAAIMDPAHAMNRAAANAFLKTLEEPPAGVLLLLIAEQPSRLPATIRSRCQVLPIVSPARVEGLDWLASATGGGREVLEQALDLAGGAPGEAVRIAGEECREERKAVLEDLVAAARGRADPVSIAERWQRLNLDDVLAWFSRWLALAARHASGAPAAATGLHDLLKGVDLRQIFDLYDEINRARSALDTQLRKDLMFETLIIHWCRLTAAGRNAA